MRNVCAKAPARHRERVGRQLAKIFRSENRPAAKKAFADFKRTWAKQLPEAVQCLSDGFAAATRYFKYANQHWKRIRSTNGVERLHGEIKRRVRAVRAFPDRASALRLITAVALHVTAKWDDRRYLDMFLPDSEKETAKAA